MSRKHTVDEVLKSLKRKQDCLININSTTIQVLEGEKISNDLGNGSWGKIDFLVNNHGYRVLKTHKFDKTI